MALIRDLEWEACLIEPRRDPELIRRLSRETDLLPGPVLYYSEVPWIAEALVSLGKCLRDHVYVPTMLASLAGLVVGQDNSCRYCFAIQRVYLRLVGYPEQQIENLERDLASAELDATDRAALEFVRRVSRSDPLPGRGDFDALYSRGLDEDQIRELAAHTALHVFMNRLSSIPAIPPYGYESLPDRWYARLLRPLLGRFARSKIHRAEPVPLAPDQISGPFGPLIRSLDGLPMAIELQRTVDEMCQSERIPLRTRGLIFAVIARMMGAKLVEQAALGWVADALEPVAVERVLSHLSGPELTEFEALALPFARETVWVEAGPLQRHARELRDVLGEAELLDLAGTVALANCLCRLEFLVEPS